MSHTRTVEAIILKAHDVGEADRFCILFTKELGKIAARARSVRKPGSRIGGTLLAPQHVSIELRESSAGYMVIDAKRLDETFDTNVTAFLHMQQGIELLLNILQDEEPLPDLFATTKTFLQKPTDAVLPFTLVLLNKMGLLPEIDNAYFGGYSENQKSYIRQSLTENWEQLPELSEKERLDFSASCAELLSQISSREMKVGSVMQDINVS
ncbi:MAG: recombination protein O N-terminal domain-containing protein [Candidatus Peribacteraceae bacterium]|nr:recombination protein O N-terminal domain-containing protein [Candidatus Peribacteraceae bacterium]MDP7477435.1 recombination protein O N-terminal domain-containing protein [Candidatus Peribacteraceae bacterium]